MKIKNVITLLVVLLALPVGVFLVDRKTNFFQKAFGTEANIEINVNSVDQTIKTEVWRNLAQGGEEKGRQLLPVIDKTRALQPKYIRIDHVYDYFDIVNMDDSGNIFYNWSNLDLMLGDIKATGAKPFISLSYMPPVLSSGDITDYPSDWGQWEQLVTATIEHISGRNELNIDGVYYEVWNEPDLFGKFKIRGGSKDYLTLYSHTVIASQRAKNINHFKIGGPATTGFYENWLNGLLEYTQNNNVRLDFLSWHKYSKKIDDFEQDLNNAIRYGGTYELTITESGPNSENDPVYDSKFAAIHTLALASILEGKIDKLFTFEIKDGPGEKKEWGRWGIMTHEKFGEIIEKPRYQALRFLNRLNGGQSLVVSGNGSWVRAIAKKKEGKIQVLLVNYDHSGTHRESVPLKLTGLVPGTAVKMVRSDFLGANTKVDFNFQSDSWESSIYMFPNSATLLEFQY